jgi:hypothetical protein
MRDVLLKRILEPHPSSSFLPFSLLNCYALTGFLYHTLPTMICCLATGPKQQKQPAMD